MKNLILVLVAVIAFTFTTNAQEFYSKVGPSVTIIQPDCESFPAIAFGGLRAEVGFKEYFIQHGLYAGAYLNHARENSGLTQQTVFDIGYIANFYPNFDGQGLGYFGTGIMLRTTEHEMWQNDGSQKNDFKSWNIPLRAGITFLPSNVVRVYLEGEYSLPFAGDKFHGFTFTLGVKF